MRNMLGRVATDRSDSFLFPRLLVKKLHELSDDRRRSRGARQFLNRFVDAFRRESLICLWIGHFRLVRMVRGGSCLLANPFPSTLRACLDVRIKRRAFLRILQDRVSFVQMARSLFVGMRAVRMALADERGPRGADHFLRRGVRDLQDVVRRHLLPPNTDANKNIETTAPTAR